VLKVLGLGNDVWHDGIQGKAGSLRDRDANEAVPEETLGAFEAAVSSNSPCPNPHHLEAVVHYAEKMVMMRR
jgi:hypothetical protein